MPEGFFFINGLPLNNFWKMWKLRIGYHLNSSIFISVFHRILDFKNGAEFPFRPLFFLARITKIEFADYADRIHGFRRSNCRLRKKMPQVTQAANRYLQFTYYRLQLMQ
jgi:hypothetical protein